MTGRRLGLRALLDTDPAALSGMPVRGTGPVCEDCGPVGGEGVGIVHIGDDTFARAHLATYAQDLIRAGWPGHVHLVRLDDTDPDQRLITQDHLYSLTTIRPDGTVQTSLVASIADVSTGVEAAVAAIASPDTRMITVADDGTGSSGDDPYDADGWLTDLDTPPAAGDPPASGDRPDRTTTPSVIDVLVRGLGDRDRDAPPPVVVALNDVFMNGEVLRARVLEAAALIDEELEEWIEIEVEFPNSVVERASRPATATELDRIEDRLGLRDEAALICEHHRSWVIESVEGLPPLADVGVRLTRNMIPFERRRLWLLEGPRLALAQAGVLFGLRTVAEAAAHPVASDFAARISRAAVAVILMAGGSDPGDADGAATEAYAAEALDRLADHTLTTTCAEVCSNGSRSIARTILSVTDGLLIAGLGVRDHALLVASWLVSVTGTEVGGTNVEPVDDPLAGYLYAAYSDGGTEVLVAIALAELGAQNLPGFADEVMARFRALRSTGTGALERPDTSPDHQGS